jgi:transposase
MGDTRLEPLVLSDAGRRTLESWAKRRKTAQGLALRARIVLACAEGRNNTAVAARLRVSRPTVRKWRGRFLARRLDWLTDEPRPGVPRTISDAQVEEVVVRTLEEVPEGATHWSKRELARRTGISPTSVHRIWRASGLQPWRTEDFKISPDPLLIGKIRDVVGLYLAPPSNAAVFAVDEKPQIQALERTAPVLPMIPGAPERRSFDYVRHGTIDLFAALNTATGKVIGHVSAQHRAVDFRDFLDQIDQQTEPGLAIHVICDNLSAHKAPAVHKWLLAHPRVQLHFTPTYSSWISQVERWFAELQRRCLDRGVFCSLDELTTALEDWIKIWNASARPLQVDQDCRPDHRPHLPILLTHLRTGTLGPSSRCLRRGRRIRPPVRDVRHQRLQVRGGHRRIARGEELRLELVRAAAGDRPPRLPHHRSEDVVVQVRADPRQVRPYRDIQRPQVPARPDAAEQHQLR